MSQYSCNPKGGELNLQHRRECRHFSQAGDILGSGRYLPLRKKKRYMGFHSVSAKNLVDHLVESYRKIWASDLEAYIQDIAEPIEVDRLIYVYL